MFKTLSLLVCLMALFSTAALANVSVTSPTNNSTQSGSVHYVATASTSCSKGVGSMGIYTAPYQLAYVVNGASLNTDLNLAPGTYNTTVEEWDNCGGASTAGVTITVTSGGQSGTVSVTAPSNNSDPGSPVNFVATASTTCSKGVGSMGIYTAPYQLAYTVNGASLNHSLSLSPGTYNATVEEWDNCGGAATTPVTFTVSGGSGGGSTFSNLQKSGGWADYGQRAPDFVDCSPSPCDNIVFSYTQNVKSPSMSGASMQMYLAGSQGYGDGLWNNHLIGVDSSQGMLDSNHTIVPTLHNFTYDVWFYGTNLGAAQAVEFDINQFFNNQGYIWGHECRIAGGNEWDVWNNQAATWVPTGIPCYPNSNSWNHLTIKVERTSSNELLYQSITLNGTTYNVNQYYEPGSAPGWYGVTINYQEDGNSSQTPYSVYLDDLNFTYQ
ncbi:MAG TPA: hypothetical protein VND65_13390 [Candidatus Binatia bacterium]|nr:hypothetical protein [Candidatus Binatia bacterium]